MNMSSQKRLSLFLMTCYTTDYKDLINNLDAIMSRKESRNNV